MSKISNGKLERLAVGAIINAANKPFSYLIARILDGDKGISFDGTIEVYVDDSEKTESLIGAVPLQVKGNKVKTFSPKKSYSLTINHLVNYYKRGGAILFVVEINDNGESKIFYKQLLAKELSIIIQPTKKQLSKSVELRPLEETTLYAVCRKFINERDFQPISLIEKNPFTEKDFPKYGLSSLTYDPGNERTSNIFDHDFTLYGFKEELRFPLHQVRFTELSERVQQIIEINGKNYIYNLEVIITAKEIKCIIENVFEISINRFAKVDNITMKFLNFESLSAQLKVLPFVQSFISGNQFAFNGISIGLNEQTRELGLFKEEINLYYLQLNKLQKVFSILGIDENKIIKENPSKPNLQEGFQFLIRAILYNDTTGLQINKADNCFVNFRLGDVLVVLFYESTNVQKLQNAFSDEILKKQMIWNYKGIDPTPHSIYINLTLESLAEGSNINHEVIRTSFDQINPFLNDVAFELTNQFCLICINAFVQSDNINLLNTAEYIYAKYQEADLTVFRNKVHSIVTINLCQIRKRKYGVLTSEDIETLLNLKTSFPYFESIELQFCISVLFESKIESELAYNKLAPERKEFYKTLPINHLYNALLLK